MIVLLAGPNGAGKSTAAPAVLQGSLGITEFLNADLIAKGLSPFDPDRAALEAGRILLQRMDAFARSKTSFGLEATLAARMLANRLESLLAGGYEFHLVFVYLSSPDLAVARVANRVSLGGHNIPEDVVRRRYQAGLRNFFALYQPLATTWQMFDNSSSDHMKMIATGTRRRTLKITDRPLWSKIRKEFSS